MNQQEVMQKVKELAGLIQQSNHPSNTLDIALLKNRCIDLYEHIQILVPNYVKEEAPVEMKPIIEEQRNLHEVSIEAIKEEEIDEIQVITEEAPNSIIEPDLPVSEPEITEVHKEQPIMQEVLLHASISKTEEQSIHEKISSSGLKNDLKEKLQLKVESLKSAITLNKKIAFVNQLFMENTVEYAKAIDRLNAASTLEESMLYFGELKHTYSWDNENELVKELRQLIEKRFNG